MNRPGNHLAAILMLPAFLCGQPALPKPLASLSAAALPGRVSYQVQSSSDRKGVEQRKSLALEITSDDGRPTSHTPVPPPGFTTRGVWFGKYNPEPPARPVPGGQPRLGPVDERPKAAVKFVPEMEGDAVRVNVSVLLGRYVDKEKAVSSLLIHENETVSVPGLEAYDVAAFKVKVVRVLPSIGEPPPAIINKSKSIEVVRSEAIDSTMPSTSVKLKNTSEKGIVAIDVRIGSAVARPQGREGRNLIEPGAVYDLRAFGGESGTVMPEGYLPVGPGQIVLNTVVFADGTFEGDADAAADYLATRAGHRTQVARLVDVLDNAVRTAALDLRALRRQVAALPDDVLNMGEREAALGRYPALGQVPASILSAPFTFGMHWVKQSLVDDITAFEKSSRQAGADDVRAWLTASRNKYSDWFARL